jgi:hypothetical protein
MGYDSTRGKSRQQFLPKQLIENFIVRFSFGARVWARIFIRGRAKIRLLRKLGRIKLASPRPVAIRYFFQGDVLADELASRSD